MAILLVSGLAVLPGVAADPTAPPAPAAPLSLRVSLAAPDAVVGASARVTYRLTNDTEEEYAGCADDWSAGVWWGPAGIRGTTIGTPFRCLPTGHFRLAPHATRTWTSEVRVLNVGLGDGRFIGVVRSTGDSWSGEVRSTSVAVVFRDVHAG